MYSIAPSLEAKVTEHLDKGFLMKAADHLHEQMSTARGDLLATAAIFMVVAIMLWFMP